MQSEHSSGDFTDFGQRVDLTSRIKEVLQNYPEGTSVLKESIQNADDAGARTISFCIDLRQHPTDSLAYASLAAFAGPALLVHNDATFTEADLQSICQVGRSVKTQQRGKTGRFGIGFNSCYHLTDLPAFVTGRHLVYFDPHCSHLGVSAANPGVRADFCAAQLAQRFPAQCSPFACFGCDMRSPFEGTLFRFALRTREQAAASRLSSQAYSPEKAAALLADLQAEAPQQLLFLKSIERLELLRWEAGAAQPQLLFSCAVRGAGEQLRAARGFFVRAAQGAVGPGSSFHRLELECQEQGAPPAVHSFLVGQALGGGPMAQRAAEATEAFGAPAVPFAGIAAPLACAEGADGLAFCFLPLPLRTGLPVHCNGFFELSSNRRDVWTGADLQGVGKMRAEWNTALLQEVAGPLYAQLLAEAATLLGPGPQFHALWPASAAVAQLWGLLVAATVRNLEGLAVAHTLAGGGRWLRPAEAVFAAGSELRNPALLEAAVAVNIPVVQLPETLLRLLLTHTARPPELLSPPFVRAALLRRGAVTVTHALGSRLGSAAALLEFCMRDVNDSEPWDLEGLPLLPALDGKLWTLQRLGSSGSGQQQRLCVGSALERRLFAGCAPDLLLDSELCGPDVSGRLAAIAAAGSLNLSRLSAAALAATFLPRALPAAWIGRAEAQWAPGTGGQPSEEWLQLLWRYLQEHKSLECAADWPLLPGLGGRLLQLRPLAASPVLWASAEWSESLQATLLALGLRPAQPSKAHSHPALKQHVHAATGVGVLKALLAAEKAGGLPDLGASLTPAQRAELRAYLLSERWLAPSSQWPPGQHNAALRLLRTLPLFETAAGGEQPSFAALSSSASLHLLPPQAPAKGLLTPDCLLPASAAERAAMVTFLGVREWRLTEFYRDALGRLGGLQPCDRDAAMGAMLRQLPLLMSEEPGFARTLRAACFVPCGDGRLRAPQELFDPSNAELQALLDARACFPAAPFASEPALRAGLRQVGLQSGLTSAAMLAIARSIEGLAASDAAAARARGRQALELLDREVKRLFRPVPGGTARSAKEAEASFWAALRSIRWLPVLQQPPDACLPWQQPPQGLAQPAQARLRTDAWLVSCRLALLDGDCRSAAVEKGLGWAEPPPAAVVAEQLRLLGAANASVTNPETAKTLAAEVPGLYAFLARLPPSELEAAAAGLQDAACIWTGAGFAPCKAVALSGSLELAPRLWQVPRELAPFADLFARLGVREAFGAEQLAGVLAGLAADFGGEPLPPKELDTALAIVQALSDLPGPGSARLCVPNRQGVLCPAADLVFNDAPWLEAHGLNVVHTKLSYEVCARVGVSQLRQALLEDSSDVLELSEAFEQSESLTTRLKHITDAYVDGPGIILELIQNADDAGASEVALLLDETTYPSQSLPGERMAAWQGPAIYCWNDAVFSPQDFHSLSKIGQDSKLDNVRATGRFGLGFNAVYHTTDLPSLVSGEYLVLLDPHCAFLPGRRKGLKIGLQRARLDQRFPDLAAAYGHFGCSLASRFEGTLFRFPLRTKETAATSEIRKIAYTPADVLRLFTAFRAEADKTLLFLKSVGKVSVYTRAPGAEPQLLFQTTAHPKGGRSPQAAICEFLCSGGGRAGKQALLQRLARTPDAMLPAQQLAVTVATAGADASEEQWLVRCALGGGPAKTLASARGCVPWVGVASRISRQPPDPSRAASLAGQAFAFLPLPVATGLPCHINAAFELSSNRRDVWQGHDTGGDGAARAEWNRVLLEHAVAPAYADLLQLAAERTGPAPEFFALWPVAPVGEPWALLRRAAFREAAARRVFWTKAGGGRWLTLAQARLPDGLTAASEPLAACLAAGGYPLAAAPAQLLEAVGQLCPEPRRASPADVRRSIAAGDFAAVLRDGSAEQRLQACELLLGYCTSDLQLEPASAQQLAGLPLLCLADGSVAQLQPASPAHPPVFVVGQEQAELLGALPHRLAAWRADSSMGAVLLRLASKGALNVAPLTPAALADAFLPALLPAAWLRQPEVAWEPGEAGQPSRAWLQRLLATVSSFEDPQALEAWPLLPVQGGRLRALSEASLVLREGSWAEPVGSALVKLGFALVEAGLLPPALGSLRRCVREPSGPAVLEALYARTGGDVSGLPGLVDAAALSDGERSQLRAFLAQLRWFDGGMQGRHLLVLRMLALFPAACLPQPEGGGGAQKEGPRWVNLDGVTCMAPLGADARLLAGSGLVNLTSEGEARVLEEKLGVLQLSTYELMKEHVLPRLPSIEPAARDAALLAFLQRRDAPGQALWAELQQAAFLPDGSGKLRRAAELCDPGNAKLRCLLPGADCFPAAAYAEDRQVLEHLRKLGLRAAVDAAALTAAIASLAEAEPSDAAAAERSGLLLAELSAWAARDAPGLDWRELREQAWCRPRRSPPEPWLPHRRWEDCFLPPAKLRPAADALAVSGGCALLDGPQPRPELSRRLGWDRAPKVSVLRRQLERLREKDITGERVGQVERSAQAVFACLQRCFEQGSPADLEHLARLQDCQCVWTGAGFCKPELAMLHGGGRDLRPALFAVPGWLAQRHEAVLGFLGVAPGLTPAHCQRGLAALAQLASGNPLPPQRLTLATELIASLAAAPGAWQPHLPDAAGVLRPPSQLYYVESGMGGWLEGEAVPEGVAKLHASVSEQQAAALGVPSLRQLHQRQSNMEMNVLPCPSAAALAGFLAQLPPGLAAALHCAAELADAGGAQRIDFWLDERQHPTQSLLSAELKACQGPALCVSIPGLVVGAEDAARLQLPPTPFEFAGQSCSYGSGFAACYRLADTLQLLSGDSLFVFDPACSIFAGPPSAGAGRQFKFAGTDLAQRFPDQFAPWAFAGEHASSSSSNTGSSSSSSSSGSHSFAEAWGGTLLRLPLRLREGKGAVCSEAAMPEAVAAVLREQLRPFGRSLLFLRSLSRISLARIAAGSGERRPLGQVSLEPASDGGRLPRLPWPRQDWASQPQGFLGMRLSQTGLKKALELSLRFETGPAAEGQAGPEEREQWALWGNAGRGSTLSAALSPEGTALRLEPLAAVAVLKADGSIVPASGVYGPLPVSGKRLSEAAAPPGFLLCAAFALQGQRAPLFETGAADSLQARFNSELLLAGAFGAWQEAFRAAAEQISNASLYHLLPDEPQLPGAFEAGELQQQPEHRFFAKVLHDAGGLRCWQLAQEQGGSAQPVALREGVFLRGDLGAFGQAGARFVRRCLPLLSAPWRVKAALDAAGVAGSSPLDAPVLRRLLKEQMRQPRHTRPAMEPAEAADLLAFCLSDCWAVKRTEGPTPLLSRLDSACPDLRWLAWSERPLQLQEQVQEAQERTCAALAALAAAEPQPGRAGELARELLRAQLLTLQRTSKLAGLPVPTATGAIAPLGERPLHFWPPWMASRPHEALDGAAFLHPAANARLAGHLLQSAEAAEGLQLHGLTLARASARLLPNVVLATYRSGQEPVVPYGVRFGGGLDASTLQALWAVLLELQRAEAEPSWEPVRGWRLLPLHGQRVMRVADRAAVFVPPPQQPGDETPPPGAWRWLLPLLHHLALPVLDAAFPQLGPLCSADGGGLGGVLLLKLTRADELGLLQLELLTPEQQEQLFGFLAANPPSADVLGGAQKALCQRLPIFLTHAGSRRPLEQLLGVCDADLTRRMAGCEPTGLPPAMQERLARADAGGLALAARFGAQPLSDGRLLAQLLLPGLDSLAPAAAAATLAWLASRWGRLEQQAELAEQLRRTAFVPDGEGRRRLPSQLYDPDTPLLRRVFEGTPDFPAGEFASARWLPILRELGLRSEVDRPTFLAIARRIDALWRPLAAAGAAAEPAARAEVWAAACEAAAYLRERGEGLHGGELYEQLRPLAFMPALQGIPGTASAARVVTALPDACAEKDWRLAWSAAPVVPEASLPRTHAWVPLGLRSPPLLATVTAHLTKLGADAGEALLASWPANAPPVEDVFGAILDHLASEGVGPETRAILQGVACVPVANATRLVPPNRLFARLKADLAPFAYEAPPAFASGDRLPVLKALGCRDAPGPEDLLQLLKGLRQAHGGGCLNANELRAAIRLLAAVADDPRGRPALAQLRGEGLLHVPGLDCRLLPAHSCVHACTAPRALLQRIDVAKVQFAHPQLPPDLCAALAIPPLELSVREVLDTALPLQGLQAIQGRSLQEVKQQLCEPRTAALVFGVVSHFAGAVPSLKALTQRGVAAALRTAAARLQFVQACATRLLLLASGLDVSAGGGASRTYDFEDAEDRVIYVAQPPEGVALEAVLARALSRQLRSPVPLPLEPALLPPAAAEAAEAGGFLLAAHVTGLFDAAEQAAVPGAPLTATDARLAVLQPGRPFAAGELCALQAQRAPGDAAATAAEQRAAGSADAAPGQALVYARVAEDARPLAGRPIFTVTVETAPGRLEGVPSHRLLTLRSGAGSSSSSSSDGEQQPASNGAPAPAAAAVQQNGGPAAAAPAETQMGAGEMAGAVRELLARAGLPVDLERTALLERSLRLQGELETASSELSAAAREAREAKMSLEEAEERWLCKICSSSPVDAVLVPCGHAICLGCAGSMADHRCFFCRKAASVQRLFTS